MQIRERKEKERYGAEILQFSDVTSGKALIWTFKPRSHDLDINNVVYTDEVHDATHFAAHINKDNDR